MQGKSLTQISLPIKVFDSKSLLEKVALFMKTAPFYLDMAADIPQTNEEQAFARFKLVVGYAISIR
jgi:hypothetical protein